MIRMTSGLFDRILGESTGLAMYLCSAMTRSYKRGGSRAEQRLEALRCTICPHVQGLEGKSGLDGVTLSRTRGLRHQ
jgi:hypothetical protein